jgi:hypothetical protein
MVWSKQDFVLAARYLLRSTLASPQRRSRSTYLPTLSDDFQQHTAEALSVSLRKGNEQTRRFMVSEILWISSTEIVLSRITIGAGRHAKASPLRKPLCGDSSLQTAHNSLA